MIRSSDQTNEVFTAFGKAQQNFPPIPKNKTVEVKAKDGKFLYSFDYADLTQIIDSTRPSLAAQGLSFSQTLTVVESLGKGYTTRIMHASGQWFESGFVPAIMLEDAGMKDVAGNVTYGKRLSLSEALGISADDDVDAPSENDETIDVKPRRPADPNKTKFPSKYPESLAGRYIEDFHTDELVLAEKSLSTWKTGKNAATFPKNGDEAIKLLRYLMTKTKDERNELDAALARDRS